MNARNDYNDDLSKKRIECVKALEVIQCSQCIVKCLLLHYRLTMMINSQKVNNVKILHYV